MAPFILSSGDHVVVTSLKADCLLFSMNNPAQPAVAILNGAKPGSEKKDIDFEATGVILAGAFSKSGKYFAVTNDYKQVFLLETSPVADQWKLLSTRDVGKKGVKIQFSIDEKQFIMADKFGDVLSFPVDDINQEGTVIFGHLSMLLDVIFIQNDRLIASCDRDEKIRVSNYPNTYNIQSFCLGHKKYVTAVVEASGLLLSGSGDSTVRVWDPANGTQIDIYTCPGEVKALSFIESSQILVCCIHKLNRLLCLKMENRNGRKVLTHHVDIQLEGNALAHCVSGDRILLLQDSKEHLLLQIDLSTLETKPVNHVNEAVASLWDSYSGTSASHSEFYSSLEKMALDNIDEYIERKGKRPASGQLDSTARAKVSLPEQSTQS